MTPGKDDLAPESKLHILLVEDSMVQAKYTKHILSENNFNVSTAASGKAAIQLIERYKPDLILSDHIMPEMSGIELCEIIKQDQRFKDIPFIIITSLTNPENLNKAKAVGVDSFLVKPFETKQLLEKIQYLIYIAGKK